MASDRSRPFELAASGPPLVRLLWEIHEDLRACLFLFLNLGGLGGSAACCRALAGCLWRDAAFWRVYGGPGSAKDPGPDPDPLSAAVLRDTFRRWLFHLDGEWVKDFEAFVEREKQSEFGADNIRLLAEASKIVSGLMPCDGRSRIEELVALLSTLLSDLDPAQLDEREVASALVASVERRDDVFTPTEISDIALAYDQSVGYAMLCQMGQGLDDRGPELDVFQGSVLDDELSAQDAGVADDELDFGAHPGLLDGPLHESLAGRAPLAAPGGAA